MYINKGVVYQQTTVEFVLKINDDMYWFCRIIENDNGRDDEFWYYDKDTDKVNENVSEEDLDKYLYCGEDEDGNSMEDVFEELYLESQQ